MDAMGSVIVLRENSVPVENYDHLLDSAGGPEVRLHFQIRKDRSPDFPGYEDKADGPPDELRLRLRSLLAANPLPGDEWEQLNEAVVEGESAWRSVPKDAIKEQAFNAKQRVERSSYENRADDSYQFSSNVSERAERAKALEKTVEVQKPMARAASAVQQRDAAADEGAPLPEVVTRPNIETGQMRAVWLGGELFLLRQISQSVTDGRKLAIAVQGVWLDSIKLREALLGGIADLLPDGKLHPVEGKRAAEDPLTMVSFPFRLERNEIPAISQRSTGPGFNTPLKVAWAALLIAILASSLLVHGIMRLSERRASFVSAVTHELRTPLTTFRLYSDMLETGAVREEKRGHYLRVLSREADRLSHLVENVLAFSRIERGNARSTIRVAEAGSLLDQFRERLEERLATAGLVLEIQATARLHVRADTAAVEHILFNLIDNAAKYAASSSPPVVTIELRDGGKFAEIIVRDHGPGIAHEERGRIFRAFHKSAREAAESQPGVGLGLALSRRLAREQGGDLQYLSTDPGTGFVLRLPKASAKEQPCPQ
jgi:signal transduction histidine kinase